MTNEMNFFDLCVACGRAIGRGCAALWRLFLRMVRLSWRYWWIVLTIVALAVAGAIYLTRPDNLCYKVNAVAFLNGPSIQQFDQKYSSLQSGRLLPADAPITSYLHGRVAEGFETFRVVDCLHDGIADYVDFKQKSAPTDTLCVQMDDRLCLQFRIRSCQVPEIPEIEKALLAYLNDDEAMQQSYRTYLKNQQEIVAFNHSQAQKLDSLTSSYYFYNASNAQPLNYNGNGVNFYGDRRIRLFLDEIYKQQRHTQLGDYRLQMATAPVTLENHFYVDPRPVMSRPKCVVIFFLLGWICACALAEIIDRRKAICEWLKEK